MVGQECPDPITAKPSSWEPSCNMLPLLQRDRSSAGAYCITNKSIDRPQKLRAAKRKGGGGLSGIILFWFPEKQLA